MTTTTNAVTGKFEVTIGKTVHVFDTEAQAMEFVANNANRDAVLIWTKAGEGGTKYRNERLGLMIVRAAFEAQLKADKVKAKDLTNANIFEIVGTITKDDLMEIAQHAISLVDSFATLTGKHQAPMKGGKLPRDMASKAAVLVKPETGAAQQSAARDELASVL